MKNKKYYIALNDREYAEIISSLINKRNSLIRLGKYTDGVDEVIMKVRKAKNRTHLGCGGHRALGRSL